MAPKSRWADDDEDTASEAKRKAEKDAKKKAKAEKQRQLDEAARAQKLVAQASSHASNQEDGPPTKRRRVTPNPDEGAREQTQGSLLLRFPIQEWGPCRHVDNFEKLNHIEEGSYGWVSRAKEVGTGEIVALKKLKMEYNGQDGFPVTGLREIQTLMASQHPNIVALREVVMGDTMNE